MFNTSFTLFILIIFVGLFLGLFVLYKGYKNKINRIFFLLTSSLLIWIFANFLEDEVKNSGLLNFLLRLDYAFGVIIILFFTIFCLELAGISFLNDRKSKLIFGLLYFSSSILILLIIFTKFIVVGYELLPGGLNPILGQGGVIYKSFIMLLPVLSLLSLIVKYKKVNETEKAQIIYLFLGLLLTVTIIILTNLFLVDYIKNSLNYTLYSRLGIFSSIFFILFSGYAIIKHRLLNIKTITAELLSLGILVFSLFQVLTARSVSELITNSVVFLVLLAFVIMLVRSVENEVKRKEELQIMSEKLSMANDQLVKLDNAKSEFISIASHQLRTPLTAIKGFVSLLLEGTYGVVEPKVRDALNKVYLSNERMVALVENLLNISRIESGRMEFEFRKWKVEDIIRELYDSFIIAAKNKGLNLNIKLPAEPLPEIEIDGPKTKEVISNLIDNALKYTNRGGVTVNAELITDNKQLTTKNEQFVRITVSDTGIGIPEKELPYLFAKFSRGKDTNRLHATGTGLGLYVGKSMIEAQHGQLTVESLGEGRGSRFVIELPVSQEKFRREERVEEFIKEI